VIAIARRIEPTLLAEARAACASLGLATEEWGGGIPRTAPQLVLTGIDPGERRLPDDVYHLLEASPGVRAVLCVNEPLVRPRINLANGRVVLLAPPFDRVRLAGVLRSLLAVEPTTISPDERRGQRFEALRRAYWVAWARGAGTPAIAIDEQRGLTLVLGLAAARKADAVVQLVNAIQPDAQRSAALAELLGTDSAMIHLDEAGGDWLFYWPTELPLWLCSAQRIPPRQSFGAGTPFAAAGRRFARIAAFPADQLVACWSSSRLAPSIFEELGDTILEGSPQTLATLAALTLQHPIASGLIVEARG
jgi:hypothetical protein